MKFEIPAGAQKILRTLADAGYEAYLVGGCVRDLLRGVAPHDWDICTSARPEETEACFAGQRIIETGLKHGTVTVLEEDEPYEITTYRTEGPYSDSHRPDFVEFVSSLEADLARRDFTMNAVALKLDGSLWVMWGLRFGAVFGDGIEKKTAQAIRENRHMLKHVAMGRIHVKLRKLLVGEQTGDVLRQYPDVLCEFWPELGPLVALEQNNPWYCWGCWKYMIHAVEAAPSRTGPADLP